MVNVIKCESKFHQFNASGKPLISPTHDVGVAQVNIPTWGKKAKSMGLDIYNSADDNLIMAKFILKTQGIKSWTCA